MSADVYFNISHRSALAPGLRGRAQLQRCRFSRGGGNDFNPVEWEYHPFPFAKQYRRDAPRFHPTRNVGLVRKGIAVLPAALSLLARGIFLNITTSVDHWTRAHSVYSLSIGSVDPGIFDPPISFDCFPLAFNTPAALHINISLVAILLYPRYSRLFFAQRRHHPRHALTLTYLALNLLLHMLSFFCCIVV